MFRSLKEFVCGASLSLFVSAYKIEIPGERERAFLEERYDFEREREER